MLIRTSHRSWSLRFSVGTTKPSSDLRERGVAPAVRGRSADARSRDGLPCANPLLPQALACCWYSATGSDFLKPNPRTDARCFCKEKCARQSSAASQAQAKSQRLTGVESFV
eukprot:COSAG04_NODE_1437_length_6768_cov_13.040936_2_plen_112_part_00